MMKYTVKYSTLFKKSFKKCMKRGCSEGKFRKVISILAETRTLPPEYKPHPLKSNYKGCMECHITSDWAKAAGFWINNTDETYKQTLGERIAQGGEAIVFDNGNKVLKTIGLDYFILPIFALDRISLPCCIM